MPAYPCDGQPETAKGRYSRLCPHDTDHWAGHDESALTTLAEGMRDSKDRRLARARYLQSVATVPSGYVYLGQFIDHDITKDNRYPADVNPDVSDTLNFRTARFDLESLYGADPAEVRCIYDDQDSEKLKLGLTKEAIRDGVTFPSSQDDLPRNEKGEAVIIDPRNDENLFVAQLQVLFSKFHNCMLRFLRQDPQLAKNLALGPNATWFEKARRFVTWHYQWIILHDFLPAIAQTAILTQIEKGAQPWLYPSGWYTPADAPVELPVELSVAAFRFGHSMVREAYRWNSHLLAERSSTIIFLTHRGGGIQDRNGLPADYVVDWGHLFGSSNSVNHARPIGPVITEMLYDLPKELEEAFRKQTQLGKTEAPYNPEPVGPAPGDDQSGDHFKGRPRMMPSLPEMTLKRGSRIRLPGGEEFADRFKFPPLNPKTMFPGGQYDFFRGSLGERTPLWYYLLCEAAIEHPVGWAKQRLGTIGSHIVAETLYQLLKADDDSILNAGARTGWTPPIVTGGRFQWKLDTMSSLTRFVAAEF